MAWGLTSSQKMLSSMLKAWVFLQWVFLEGELHGGENQLLAQEETALLNECFPSPMKYVRCEYPKRPRLNECNNTP